MIASRTNPNLLSLGDQLVLDGISPGIVTETGEQAGQSLAPIDPRHPDEVEGDDIDPDQPDAGRGWGDCDNESQA